jgi:hypothetical protein
VAYERVKPTYIRINHFHDDAIVIYQDHIVLMADERNVSTDIGGMIQIGGKT